MILDHALPPPTWAKRLGYFGLLPFLALALAIWVSGPFHRVDIAYALLGYGATIASFLGAIHWGLSMRDTAQSPTGQWVWGVVPSLVSWMALMAGPNAGLWVMAALLAACFLVDRVVYPRFLLQEWLPMRLTLTLAACISCIVGACF